MMYNLLVLIKTQGDVFVQDDDFIKKAYAKGRVKEAWEAFQEYLPEEEWHKGKIENIL